jgi:hypothetical protein
MKSSVIRENLNLGIHLARAGDLDLLPRLDLDLGQAIDNARRVNPDIETPSALD